MNQTPQITRREILLTVVLPKEQMYEFLEKFGNTFSVSPIAHNEGITRFPHEYALDPRDGDSAYVIVKLSTEEEGMFNLFIAKFTSFVCLNSRETVAVQAAEDEELKWTL